MDRYQYLAVPMKRKFQRYLKKKKIKTIIEIPKQKK